MDAFSPIVVGVFVCLGIVAFVLVKPIMMPSIITFPWNDPKQQEDRIVILAGSYNPPHIGHLAMLQYLSKRYKTVIAVIGFNPDKKYLVTPEERKGLLKKMVITSGCSNIEVQVVDGYIWRYAKRRGATGFFRGIRTWEKDGKDEQSLQILNTWGPLLLGPLVWPVPTTYLEGHPKYNHVSSTAVRQLSARDKNSKELLADFLPENLTEEVSRLYGRKND